jgi:hypothetical protein
MLWLGPYYERNKHQDREYRSNERSAKWLLARRSPVRHLVVVKMEAVRRPSYCHGSCELEQARSK